MSYVPQNTVLLHAIDFLHCMMPYQVGIFHKVFGIFVREVWIVIFLPESVACNMSMQAPNHLITLHPYANVFSQHV